MKIILSYFKQILLFFTLISLVLIVNFPIIDFNMFYPEQALIYLANQRIEHWYDLLQIYIHPQLFHWAIVFFRPSGHFLIYQLLTPYLGWHSNKIFITVNLFFLAGTGFVILKTYPRLFPGFRWGGFIAFAIYLMHPALSLSRIIILHFEFAYVFLSLWSCYLFIVFMQKNDNFNSLTNGKRHSSYFLYSLCLYAFAVTFKEAAVVMGGVLLAYFLLFLYQGETLKKNLLMIIQQKHLWQISLIICLTTLFLIFYVSLAWPTLADPFQDHTGYLQAYLTCKEFVKLIFGFGNNFQSNKIFQTGEMPWRSVIFPWYAQIILWSCLAVSFIGMIFLFNPKNNLRSYRVPSIFLFMAALITLTLPVCWGMGAPWHLSLTLLFLSFLFGFSFEYLISYHAPLAVSKHSSVLLLMSLVIAFSAYGVNCANVNRYIFDRGLNFQLQLNRNAILHPPAIQSRLTENSLLVVMEPDFKNSYMMGAGSFPLQLENPENIALAKVSNQMTLFKIPMIDGGTLFRWAYLQPHLREQLSPYRMTQMTAMPNEIIYDWLQSYPQVFCLTYDDHANWVDNTSLFKQHLLQEQLRRKMKVHTYEAKLAVAFVGNIYAVKYLDFANKKTCEYLCSQDASCLGFNFVNVQLKDLEVHQCQLMNEINPNKIKFSPMCVAYLKKNVIV